MAPEVALHERAVGRGNDLQPLGVEERERTITAVRVQCARGVGDVVAVEGRRVGSPAATSCARSAGVSAVWTAANSPARSTAW